MRKIVFILCLILTFASLYPTTRSRWVIFPAEVQFRDEINFMADVHGIDRALFMGLIAHESIGFRQYATSPSGARGLSQLMPATAYWACADLFQSGNILELYDPHKNLWCGARYLSQQLHDFKGCEHCALWAYNAGPGATRRAGKHAPTLQAALYVPAVLHYAAIYRGAAR